MTNYILLIPSLIPAAVMLLFGIRQEILFQGKTHLFNSVCAGLLLILSGFYFWFRNPANSCTEWGDALFMLTYFGKPLFWAFWGATLLLALLLLRKRTKPNLSLAAFLIWILVTGILMSFDWVRLRCH